MTYGGKILKDDGTLWLSPDFTPLNFLTKGTISATVGTVFQSTIPSSKQAMFFVSYDAVGVVVFQQTVTNGFRSLTVVRSSDVGSVTIYAFGNTATRRSNEGVFFFNAAGEMVFSMDMRPLQIQSTAISITADGSNIDIGQPVAVLPTFSGRASVQDSGVGGYAIFNYYTGATGNSVINRRIQIGSSSGPAGFSFNNTAFFIYTNLYN